MDEYLRQLFADMKAACLEAWPDCAKRGPLDGDIWEAMHIQQVAFEKLKPPYGVVHIERLPPDRRWPANGVMFNPTIHLYRVATVDGPMSDIITDLETLRDIMATRPLSNGAFVASIGEVSWDMTLPPNVILAGSRQPQRAGCIDVEVVIGQSVSP